MKPNHKQEAGMWLAQAEADYSSLDLLLKAGKFDLVCFLSEQAAEKAIKGFLISRGEEMVFSHSIAKLCDIAGQHDSEFLELKNQIKHLTPYYVEARYPNALELVPAAYFDEEDARGALEMAKKAIDFVKSRIPK